MTTYMDLSDEDRELAFDRIIGFRMPNDDRQLPAYAVAFAFRLAALGGITDQDLADKFAIDLLLGRGEDFLGSITSKTRSALERMLGRPIDPGEPRPLDIGAIREEQQRRNSQREAQELFT